MQVVIFPSYIQFSMETRPSWDDYFLEIAQVVSSRSTCFRKHVGAVITRDKYIVATGYNGAPQYQRNCKDIGFCYRDKHKIPSLEKIELCRAVGSHAESNAIALAARNGFSTEGSTIYVIGHYEICNQCRALIVNSGIARVVFKKDSGEVEVILPRMDWKVHPIDQIIDEHF